MQSFTGGKGLFFFFWRQGLTMKPWLASHSEIHLCITRHSPAHPGGLSLWGDSRSTGQKQRQVKEGAEGKESWAEPEAGASECSDQGSVSPSIKGQVSLIRLLWKSSETTIKMLTFLISNSVILLGGYTWHFDLLVEHGMYFNIRKNVHWLRILEDYF